MPSAFVIVYFHKSPAMQICLQPAYKGLTLISPPVTTKQIIVTKKQTIVTKKQTIVTKKQTIVTE